MLPFAVHVSLSAVHRAPLFVGFTKALGVTRSRAPNPNHPRAQKLGAFARIGIMWEHPSTKRNDIFRSADPPARIESSLIMDAGDYVMVGQDGELEERPALLKNEGAETPTCQTPPPSSPLPDVSRIMWELCEFQSCNPKPCLATRTFPSPTYAGGFFRHQ